MLERDLSPYTELGIYLLVGIVFILGGLITAWIIRPSRPNEEKNTVYECGEEPVGTAWGQYNIRFYIVAILFLLFEVEVIFLFPWASILDATGFEEQSEGLWASYVLVEMFLFVFLLALGLAFAWRKGFLDWEKPKVKVPESNSNVPYTLYEAINKKYA